MHLPSAGGLGPATGSTPEAAGTAIDGARDDADAPAVATDGGEPDADDGPRLLSGGNPQIPKGDGDAPVQAYLDAVPGWKRDVARQIDALVERTVPDVRKAVRWNSPFYGVEGRGWFLSLHCYTRYVKLTFLRGASLDPPPPGESAQEHVRYLDVREDDELDEARLADWIRQAAEQPGEALF